jgi:hypothetical protein
LPADLRAERRGEIDSDLWEQKSLAAHRGDPAFRTAIEVLARMLFGVISDITWRAQAGAPARADRSIRMNEGLYMRALIATGVVLALFMIVTGIASIADALLDPDVGSGMAAFGAITLLAGAAVAAGLLTCRRNPLLGIGLVAIGAITVAVAWYWMLVITIPIGIALVAIAFFRARQTGWPRTGSSGPTSTA